MTIGKAGFTKYIESQPQACVFDVTRAVLLDKIGKKKRQNE